MALSAAKNAIHTNIKIPSCRLIHKLLRKQDNATLQIFDDNGKALNIGNYVIYNLTVKADDSSLRSSCIKPYVCALLLHLML